MRKRRVRRPVTFTSGVELRGPRVEKWVWGRGMQTGTGYMVWEQGCPRGWGLACLGDIVPPSYILVQPIGRRADTG